MTHKPLHPIKAGLWGLLVLLILGAVLATPAKGYGGLENFSAKDAELLTLGIGDGHISDLYRRIADLEGATHTKTGTFELQLQVKTLEVHYNNVQRRLTALESSK